MIISEIKHSNISTPIENYSAQLAWYMQNYINIINAQSDEMVRITLRWFIFPNNKEFEKDFNHIKHKLENKTFESIRQYTVCLMQMIGKLAECVVVDKCGMDDNINRICINIALYNEDIYHEYQNINVTVQ